MNYVIGTRGSRLALAQAEFVRGRLARAYPNDTFEIRIIRTKGDMILDRPLDQIGDKGVFVKEIEEQLVLGNIQIGVHSMKDMPSEPAPGLIFTKAWKREDPRDALVLREKSSLFDLPQGATLGTGSKRRALQLTRIRPDLQIVGVRGNVDTRLKKMQEERLDGLVLAAAGLHRLGMQDRIAEYLETDVMIPAPAQGVLALEIHSGDRKLGGMLDALCDEETEWEAAVERGFLREIGGSCQAPIGAVCQNGKDGRYRLSVMFGRETGGRCAYATVYGSDPKSLIQKAAAKIRQQLAGRVFLVGGGPGDPGLVTVKAQKAIREADCIVYDRLCPTELLEEARKDCERINAGKASHDHTMEQTAIQKLLVCKSMEYDKVVRLKGGDPYVFGRGGEEGMFLQAHGVPFEVIPGVSSAVAGPAYAGIPITHRGMSLGFHVVTAHDREDTMDGIDFRTIAQGQETTVFLMGLSRVREIADGLMQAGMPGSTQAAVIAKATTPEQKTCVSDLMHIAQEAEKSDLASPALIVVGSVVSLRDSLSVFERQPLFGKRYLIPKIGRKPTALREFLQSQGAAVDEIQVGEIVIWETPFRAEQFWEADWLIFTSKNGVEAFFQNFMNSGLDMRVLAGCKLAAIGAKTAECLKSRGLYADLAPKRFDSDALLDTLKTRWRGYPNVWYLKAGNADGDWTKALHGICNLTEITVYENRAVDLDVYGLRPLQEYDGAWFTCASSAERLLDAVGRLPDAVPAYSIGPKTTAYLKTRGIENVIQAKQATYEGLAALANGGAEREMNTNED